MAILNSRIRIVGGREAHTDSPGNVHIAFASKEQSVSGNAPSSTAAACMSDVSVHALWAHEDRERAAFEKVSDL